MNTFPAFMETLLDARNQSRTDFTYNAPLLIIGVGVYTGNRVQKKVSLASAYPRILEDNIVRETPNGVASGDPFGYKRSSVWLQTELSISVWYQTEPNKINSPLALSNLV